MRAYTAGLNRRGAALCLSGLLSGLVGSAWAAEGAGAASTGPATHPASGQTLDFDIPAQPLASALDRYASLSGWPILFHGEMVAGRISSPLQGRYSPETALRRLLDGTGLAPKKVTAGPADAYTLNEIGPPSSGSGAATPAVDFDYAGWIQPRIWEALCSDARAAPGNWRSVLRFRVDASGHVYSARMFGSTGNGRRDAAVLDALRRVRVDRPPPPSMAQPLTMLVLPLDQGGGQRCNTGSRAAAGGGS